MPVDQKVPRYGMNGTRILVHELHGWEYAVGARGIC